MKQSEKEDTITVLLVEDQETNAKIVGLLLELLGCRALIVHTAQEALTLISQDPQKFDLILLDIGLPDRNGMEIFPEIQALLPKNRKVPVFAVSAYLLEEAQQRCYAVGMDEVLSKPFTVERLSRVIEKHLPHKANLLTFRG